MPTLLTRREGETLEIGGVTLCVAVARDKSATLVIAGYDVDGLLEGAAEVKRRAGGTREIDHQPFRECNKKGALQPRYEIATPL